MRGVGEVYRVFTTGGLAMSGLTLSKTVIARKYALAETLVMNSYLVIMSNHNNESARPEKQ